MRKATSIKNPTTQGRACRWGESLVVFTCQALRGKWGEIQGPKPCKKGNMETVGNILIPQGGTGNAGESIPRPSLEDTRKRKAKAPSVKSVAAKYNAVALPRQPLLKWRICLLRLIRKRTLPTWCVYHRSPGRNKLCQEFALELRTQAGRKVEEHIDRQLQAIEEVANRSRNLKGSYVQSLRLAVRNVKAAADELARRSATDENFARLERENAELRSALSSLSNRADKLTEEINYLRKQTHKRIGVTNSTADAPVPKNGEEALMERIGALIESKLAAFEARLLPIRHYAHHWD
ncbi:unnamed protein product, partial [Iphiclides podalirius]